MNLCVAAIFICMLTDNYSIIKIQKKTNVYIDGQIRYNLIFVYMLMYRGCKNEAPVDSLLTR